MDLIDTWSYFKYWFKVLFIASSTVLSDIVVKFVELKKIHNVNSFKI